MATNGVKWDLDTSIILEAIKKAKGRVSHVCKALDVSPTTFYVRMHEEEVIEQALKDARNAYDLSLLDAAEDTLYFALSKRDDGELGNSLKSAFFILNNKGKDLGYSPENNPNNSKPITVKVVDYSEKTQEPPEES